MPKIPDADIEMFEEVQEVTTTTQADKVSGYQFVHNQNSVAMRDISCQISSASNMLSQSQDPQLLSASKAKECLKQQVHQNGMPKDLSS